MGYHVRIKVCGVTRPGDVHAAARLGADAIGLNFHPPSPRSIRPEAAAALLREFPMWLTAVGVFASRPLAEARAVVEPLQRVQAIQMHGGPHEVASVYPWHLIPAFAVRDEHDLTSILLYLDACRSAGVIPGAVLVDGHAPGLQGGTGQKAPWRLLADFQPGVPLILAGGLTPENVGEAVRMVRPWAVDVASGIESAPGEKDPEKMRRFILEARAAADHS